VVESDGVEEAMLNVGGGVHPAAAGHPRRLPIAKYLAKNGPGLHHLGFGVDSVEARWTTCATRASA
jgi:methylmalonyl-CoA/ethylmalonyl-CoA epimerase